MNLYI
jgi:hypothetical protein